MARKRSRTKKEQPAVADVQEPLPEVQPDTEAPQEISAPTEDLDQEPDSTKKTETPVSATASEVPTDDPENVVEIPANSPDARQAPRHTYGIKTVVHFKNSVDESWREVVEIVTVSRNGAGMSLSRPCPVGRLVSLVMEMPSKLRSYDHFAEVYPVAGVVQNCTEVLTDDGVSYHVGVAFIGKQLPDSYRQDPTTTYRITGVDQNGLWTVVEMRSGFQDRGHPRFWTEIGMSLTYRDQRRMKVQRAIVKTRDISRGGMAIWGPLAVGIGETVKVSSKEHNFFSVATIKNRTDHPRDISRSLIHLEFETEFPVETIRGSEDPDGEPEPDE